MTSVHDGSSVSARVTGTLFEVLYDEGAQAPECTPLALEFGTVPLPQVLLALRAEQWLNLHPDAPAPLAASIRQQLRDAFYVDSDAWKGQVISQARQAMFQAVDGLAA